MVTMTTSHKAIRLETPGAQRTLIVVGCGRGGTSLVAGAASILGVDMGTDDTSTLHEDLELVYTAQGRDRHGNLMAHSADVATENLKQLVRARNEANDLWGWKDPSADLYLEAISEVVRHPFVLFVNRDIAAIAQSEFKRMQSSIEQAYEQALLRFGRYWVMLQRLQWPTLLVSYERAALDPEALLREVADFIGLAPPNEKQVVAVKAFASGRSYQRIGQSPD